MALSSLLAAAIGCGPHDAMMPRDGGRADGAADLAPRCVGVKPPLPAWGAPPGPLHALDGGVAAPDGGVGQAGPAWALKDFQPRSCGFGATYGLEAYRGKAVLLALWAGW